MRKTLTKEEANSLFTAGGTEIIKTKYQRDEAEEKVVEAYEQWLMDHCSDQLHTKDQLIEAAEDGFRYEDFVKGDSN